MIVGAGRILYSAVRRMLYDHVDYSVSTTLKRGKVMIMYIAYDMSGIHSIILLIDNTIVGIGDLDECDSEYIIDKKMVPAYSEFENRVWILCVYYDLGVVFDLGVCYLKRYAKIHGKIYNTRSPLVVFNYDEDIVQN